MIIQIAPEDSEQRHRNSFPSNTPAARIALPTKQEVPKWARRRVPESQFCSEIMINMKFFVTHPMDIIRNVDIKKLILEFG